MQLIDKNTTLTILNQHKSEFVPYGIVRIGLFGSVVRNENKPNSDIDLLIEFAPGHKTYKNFIKSIDLAEKILNHPVDMITKESLSPYIGEKILREAQYVEIG